MTPNDASSNTFPQEDAVFEEHEIAFNKRLIRLQTERDAIALRACYLFAGGEPEQAKEQAWKAVALDEELKQVEI